MVHTIESYTVYSFLDTELMENKKNRVNFTFKIFLYGYWISQEEREMNGRR